MPEAYTFFYGSRAKTPNHILSQHYMSSFTAPSPKHGEGDLVFKSAEQYMMYAKAILFDDEETAREIMLTANPVQQKWLEREVKGFDDRTWDAHKSKIVFTGNLYKFRNEDLRERLLATGSTRIVEAAANDRIWGIGFNEKDATKDGNKEKWGLNLLGVALTQVREILQKDLESATSLEEDSKE